MAKGKHILHQCAHCDRITKMELIGATDQQPDRSWYRCTRCRHATLINLEDLRRVEQEAKRKLDRTEASEYHPENSYSVGQAIFHTDWGDVGKIISKERTSGGGSAIVVSFEKLGERRLMENIAVSPESLE
jgi:DNA-directed RNA polymerase subunit RPC12/RpoP